jgi:hypothetical protein
LSEHQQRIIGAGSAPLLGPEQIKAIERKAAQFADALHAEGIALDAPDKRQAAKMLAFLAAGRLIARLSTQEKMSPEQAEQFAKTGIANAVRFAMRQEIADAGRKLALLGGDQ